MDIITIIGWGATFFVILSFFFTNLKLRYINIIGAVLWTIWGFGLEQMNVWTLNIGIILIHLYMIHTIKRKQRKIKSTEKTT